jgi:formamidopyrimidine-DNA glycosylase
MPELPEVENVKISLEKQGFIGQEILKVELLRADLRVPFPKDLPRKLKGQTFAAISRRAKYLIFETEKYSLLSHLGMTGSWRPFDKKLKHDHIILHFKSGVKLAFNDPRRFGLLDMIDTKDLARSRWLKHLGPEPFAESFTGESVFQGTRKLKGPIKGWLMDQRRVVGVGNIYASEALFAAKIKPSRAAGKITRQEAELLVVHIRRILTDAIEAGGSTIRDYRNSEGKSGEFQTRFLVYDRAGEKCLRCKDGVIKSKVIAGRNTFWCPKCQR